jgi:hypothetical protein
MSADTPERIVKDYLRRLSTASRVLPRAERRELRAQIDEHLRVALSDGPGEAQVRTVLERLGEPEEIVAEQAGARLAAGGGAGVQVWVTVFLLLFGTGLFLVGWFVGVVMLWSSRAWTTGEKVLGTLILPGGIFGAFFILASMITASGSRCITGATVVGPGVHVRHLASHCTGGTSTIETILAITLTAFIVIAPIATAVMLVRRARPVLV